MEEIRQRPVKPAFSALVFQQGHHLISRFVRFFLLMTQKKLFPAADEINHLCTVLKTVLKEPLLQDSKKHLTGLRRDARPRRGHDNPRKR